MQLITQNEVISLAFMPREEINPLSIRNLKIDIAEQRYIRPRFGDTLFNEFLSGEHIEFVENFIKPALAHYVKAEVIEELSIQLSDQGAILYDATTQSESSLDAQENNLVEVDGSTTTTKTDQVQEIASSFQNIEFSESKKEDTTELTKDVGSSPSGVTSSYEIGKITNTDSLDKSTQNSTTEQDSSLNQSVEESRDTTASKTLSQNQNAKNSVVKAATDVQRKAIAMRAISDGATLLAKAVREVEANLSSFPTYVPFDLSKRIFF